MRGTLLPVVTILMLAVGCASEDGDAVAVANPTVTLSTSTAAIGSPIEMSYRFVLPPDAPSLSDDYWVFVHFLDVDRELMWTDDHQPPTPVGQWKPGSTIEYQRTVFVPRFPYVGAAQVEIGLYSRTTGERLPLAGESMGQRSYKVAAFDMTLQSDNLFVVFRDGWHPVESAGEGLGVEWQWSTKDATLTFPNPMRNVRIYLSVDQPSPAVTEPQQIQVRLGPTVVDTFSLVAGQSELRRIAVPAGQLGNAEVVEMTLSVDKTFVPATIPALASSDPRELGIRVFRVFVEPR